MSRESTKVSTKAKGKAAEAIALAFFLRAGHEVLIPACEDEDYDLVVVIGGHVSRIQVKVGRRTPKGYVTASAHSVTRAKGGGWKKTRSSASLFAVVVGNEVYLIENKGTGPISILVGKGR